MAFAPAALKVREFTPTFRSNARREESPYSFQQQTYDFMGEAWAIEVQCAPLQGADLVAVRGWLAGLGGARDAFQLRWPGYAGPSAGLVENPTAAQAATVRARTISVALPAAGQLAVGDLMTIGQSLHIVTAAETPAAGVQGVTLWPRLRANLAQGGVLNVLDPYGTFALAAPAALPQNLDVAELRLQLAEAF